MDFTNIIFRGRSKSDNKTWIFGDLLHSPIGMFIGVNLSTWNMISDEQIDYCSSVFVESQTVGVNFGHKDINGKLIFTGDIVKDKDNNVFIIKSQRQWEKTRYMLPSHWPCMNFKVTMCMTLKQVS